MACTLPLTALALASMMASGCMQESTAWQDPSKHRLQFVTVERDVRLEVLDWGGSGWPVVLLAGLGNTAHVFDDFAEKLSGAYHVYGITRRGYGASSRPTSGYTAQRLADDVLNVLDSLRLVKPVLAGHSIAGEELTVLGAKHSNRIAGLVYLDAIADPTARYPGYDALLEQLPAAIRNQPTPTDADLRSFRAYREWQRRNNGAPFPEAELRNGFASSPDGRVGEYRTPGSIRDAIIAGALKPDYARVTVPVLAFVAFPPSVEDQMQRRQVYGDRERKVVEQVYDADLYWIRRRIQDLQTGVPGAHIIELRRANHYVFLSNEADVLREVQAFLADLHQGSNTAGRTVRNCLKPARARKVTKVKFANGFQPAAVSLHA